MTRTAALSEWFVVTFDDEGISLAVAPPGGTPWEARLPWSSIERICFVAEPLELSDGIYFFTSLRPESWVVPTEARGGQDLWAEVLRRRLFDAELAIEAATSAGGVYCWPEG